MIGETMPRWRASAGSRILQVALGLALAGVMVLAAAPDAEAAALQPDITPPDPGCLGYDSGASGLRDSIVTPESFELEVDGPVVQAVIEWTGIWRTDPTDPDIGVEITGPGGTNGDPAVSAVQSVKDPTRLESNFYFAHGFFADITDLFGDGEPGTYEVELTSPVDGQDPPENHWWGATVTVVYDTTPCGEITEVIWKTGADYYFGGRPSTSPTTELIVYEWSDPLEEDYLATFQTSQGGSDHESGACRVSAVWVATGAAGAPGVDEDLVDDDGNPNPAYGGIEGIINPFTPPSQSCPPPQLTDPVTAIEGGHVGPQYALVRFDVLIPAGSTWAAFQLESPADGGGGTGLPESGTWSGGGLLTIPFTIDDPDIALEKTVLEGGDADCPGVEGTDELVTGETDDPVTYCFRVTNTGNTALFPVELDDPDLGITHDDMTLVSGDDTIPLPPDGELVYSHTTNLTGDLLNTADVTGHPVDDNGDPIPDLDPVTDTNDAQVEVLTVTATLDAFCDSDTPWLAYEVTASAGVAATVATITFADGDDSEVYEVDIGEGVLLWPGAEIDEDGEPVDWPGWDVDEDGEWFLNPDNPYAWARGDVSVTVEVNPTFGPVTLSYPPAEPACAAEPPETESEQETEIDTPETEIDTTLPRTGTSSDGQAATGAVLVLLGAGAVIAARIHRNRSERSPDS